MGTKNSQISRLIKQVKNTQDEEINCSECLDQISAYVDMELESGDAVQRMPRVKQHLEQCKVCREEYQILKGLTSLEEHGKLPDHEELIHRLKRRT